MARASAFQAEGREFESRFPLHSIKPILKEFTDFLSIGFFHFRSIAISNYATLYTIREGKLRIGKELSVFYSSPCISFEMDSNPRIENT